nr:MAG TPA: hypothetical protein [Caudoviricetes sp.]
MFTQGECPGLGAAALSGRVKKQPAIHHGRLAATKYNLLNFLKKLVNLNKNLNKNLNYI